jgi:Ca-activated chloride channel family protein
MTDASDERNPLQGPDTNKIVATLINTLQINENGRTDGIQLETATGEVGWIVFSSDSDGQSYEWEVGTSYRLENIDRTDSTQIQRNRKERVRAALSNIQYIDELAKDDDEFYYCPDCGGMVDTETVVDIEPVALQCFKALSDPVWGIGDASVTIEPAGERVDDWQGQHSEKRGRGRSHSPEALICQDCRLNVTERYQQQIAKRQQTEPNSIESADADHAPRSGSADHLAAPQSNAASAPSANAEVGMATGGAKDATNFRDNIKNGYLPQPDSLAFEGLFYDYHFDTGATTESDSLFYPTYATAITNSPHTGTEERYLTVGLNSNLTEQQLERKPLNLVAVVDISGSMSSEFNQYYYDQHGSRREVEGETQAETKMEAARTALSALTEQLRPEDRLGVVLYNSDPHVAKPLRRVENTDMEAIRGHIKEVQAGGGTDMMAGFESAMDLFEPHLNADLSAVENRVVFLTDAMPNRGATDQPDIVDRFEQAATHNVHTTFVGVGIDSNPDLVESISGIRGANHYFVHSTQEFTQRLADEFTYMVTPLVFDLSVEIVSDGYQIEAIYGSPTADKESGDVLEVNTLFPSPTNDGETRGGVTLLKISKVDPEASLEIVAEWVERDGTQGTDRQEVSFTESSATYFSNSGIRKAVLLSRYGETLRNWMAEIRTNLGENEDDISEVTQDGWIYTDEQQLDQGEWETGSVTLTVPPKYQFQFKSLKDYFESEMEKIGDESLRQEIEILELLTSQT